MRAAHAPAADETEQQQQPSGPECVDVSQLSMGDHGLTKSLLEKHPSGRIDSHRESEQSDALLSAYQDQEEQQDEKDDEDNEDADADDEDYSALKKAARAGIQLLEENAQLTDEVHHLQLQLARGDEHCQELQRMLEAKDAQMEQLTQHLRESICENQSVLAELNQAKAQVAGYKTMLEQEQQPQKSPRKRNSSPKRTTQQQHQQRLSVLKFNEANLSSQPHISDDKSATGIAEHDDIHSSSADAHSQSSSPVGPISPKRRQAARLEEVEAKFEEEHRRNSILKMELTSVQKTVSELKPLNAQLHEIKEENQVLRAQIEKLEKQLNLSLEESAEESALIQSLRTTIEIYQSLDDPSRGTKHQHGFRKSTLFTEADDGDHTRRFSKMRRRRSDGCIIPLIVTQPPLSWTTTADDCFNTREDSELVLESLDSLVDQLLSLQQQKEGKLLLNPGASRIKDDTSVVTLATCPRTRFLEQQVMVLQDLLRRYRAQWRQSTEKRSSVETENGNLLSRIDALNVLVQRQCEICTQANEELTQESEAWKAAASAYETLLQQVTEVNDHECEAEADSVCFSILRHLVDSWTADKSKRMKLHDWLTNAIRRTGTRKPLYLPDLTDEIASGFQMLLVPILCQKFGVDVQIEKRLRNVVVTDLKLHITATDEAKAKACLQRMSRSLMWLVDIESAHLEENEWLGEVSCKKAARVYQRK